MKTLLILINFIAFLGTFLSPQPLLAEEEYYEPEVFRIVTFGDSLTSGDGLEEHQSFPYVLQEILLEEGHFIRVINAGVPGDTTKDGLDRIQSVIDENPHLVILELGINDGFNGIEPDVTKQNLSAILDKFYEQDIRVLFTGIKAPPSLEKEKAEEFENVFSSLAQERGVLFYPSFMEGIISKNGEVNKNFLQSDGLHPNADGVKVIAYSILPLIKTILDLE